MAAKKFAVGDLVEEGSYPGVIFQIVGVAKEPEGPVPGRYDLLASDGSIRLENAPSYLIKRRAGPTGGCPKPRVLGNPVAPLGNGWAYSVNEDRIIRDAA